MGEIFCKQKMPLLKSGRRRARQLGIQVSGPCAEGKPSLDPLLASFSRETYSFLKMSRLSVASFSCKS